MSICWDNSKYVSTCVHDTACLCTDDGFQNVGIICVRSTPLFYAESLQAVLQCLYSQCHTAQFGLALHFALTKCATYNNGPSALLPHLLIHQKNQQKRENHRTGSVYHSASLLTPTSALHDVQRRLLSISISVSIYAQPTRQAAYDTAKSQPLSSPQPTASLLMDSEDD